MKTPGFRQLKPSNALERQAMEHMNQMLTGKPHGQWQALKRTWYHHPRDDKGFWCWTWQDCEPLEAVKTSARFPGRVRLATKWAKMPWEDGSCGFPDAVNYPKTIPGLKNAKEAMN